MNIFPSQKKKKKKKNVLLALAFLACGGHHILLRLLSLHLCNEYLSQKKKKEKKDGASAISEDSLPDTDSGPLLLPAKGEAASGTPAWDEEARGVASPKPPASDLGAG